MTLVPHWTPVLVRRPARVLLAAAAALAGLCPSPTLRAAQTDVAISMAAPPPAPHLVAPATIGAVPNSPFLYTIPASGQRPMTFAAAGLPTGLTLDAATGQISGNAGPAATSAITVTATNTAGSDHMTLTLVVGGTLAPTPPMGWNSYDSYGATVTESDMLSQAKAQLSVLQPFGWRYVVVDYLWFDSEDAIDSNGRYLPSISRFPSATGTLGFKPLADQIHAMGLGFGIHIMRGIPRKSVTMNTPIAGSTSNASDAADTAHNCPWDSHMYGVNGASAAGQAWYDSIFSQYAAWGIDFVKVDDMINNQVNPLLYHQAEVDAIRAAIDKTGRSIVLSLSPGPMQTADSQDLGTNATMWRMVNDFWDQNGLSTLADVFTAGGAWQAVSGIGVGHWPDADMLPLGYMEPRCPVSGNHRSALTHNQQVSVMSFWSILPSPLILGGNVVDLTADSTTGPFTTALLTNDEVLAIDQDALGQKGHRVSLSGSQEVWTKALSGGRTAVALFNHATSDQPVSATWTQLGWTGAPPTVRDVWQRVAVTAASTGISVTVPYGGALLYVLSPSDTGGADASAEGGSGSGGSDSGGGSGGSDSGGDTGAGAKSDAGVGTSGDAGANAGVDAGTSGGTPDGGSPSSSGGGSTGDAGAGASQGSDAAAGAGGGAAPSTSNTPASSGCGCIAVGSARGGQAPGWPALVVPIALLLGWSRRQRRGS